MKSQLETLQIFQLSKETPGLMPSLGESAWQALGVPSHDLKKTHKLPSISEKLKNARNELIIAKRHFLEAYSLVGASDWLLLPSDSLDAFLKDFNKLEKKAKELKNTLLDTYTEDRQKFGNKLAEDIASAGILPGEPALHQAIAEAYLDKYYPSLETLEQWGYTLFYPLPIFAYLGNYGKPAKARKGIEKIIAPAIPLLENKTLELCADYLKAWELNKNLKEICEALTNLGPFLEIFKPDLPLALHRLGGAIFLDIADLEPLDPDQIRKEWAGILADHPLDTIGARNLANWIDPAIASPKSRSSSKDWSNPEAVEIFRARLLAYDS